MTKSAEIISRARTPIGEGFSLAFIGRPGNHFGDKYARPSARSGDGMGVKLVAAAPPNALRQKAHAFDADMLRQSKINAGRAAAARLMRSRRRCAMYSSAAARFLAMSIERQLLSAGHGATYLDDDDAYRFCH